MKIGLNATCLDNRASGAKQRFIGIYKELFKLLGGDEFVVYEPADCQISCWFDKSTNVTYKRTPLFSQSRSQKYLRGLLYWPSTLKAERHDVFEGFNLPLVKAPTGRTVLTIHDIRGIYLNNLRPGHRQSELARAVYKTVLERSLKAADHVITVSESVRNEILDLYPKTPISVIYNGIDIEDFEIISEADMLTVRQKFSLPEEFLLAVGHFEKRKNYAGLVDALARLHERGRSIHLVLIGNDSGEMTAIKEKVHSLRLSKYVRMFNGLADLEVRCIYKLCKLFVFPSEYEGFGIPILEAMAAKCPMVLSDISVFREITQGQGVYFSHNDPDSIARAIDEVLSSNSERARLIQYGSDRVRNFSFRRISMDLARLYSSLA